MFKLMQFLGIVLKVKECLTMIMQKALIIKFTVKINHSYLLSVLCLVRFCVSIR